MKGRQKAVAEIISAVTGIEPNLLTLFPELDKLLKVVDTDDGKQKLYCHGILVFGWPTDGKPHLSVYSQKTAAVADLARNYNPASVCSASAILEFSLENIVTEEMDEKYIGPLTYKEIQVLKIMGAGLSNREIAEQLEISENTVKGYCATIFSKLGVVSRAAATYKFAREIEPR